MRAYTLARYVNYMTRVPCYGQAEAVFPDGKLCRDCDRKVLALISELLEHIHEETVEPKATAALDPVEAMAELEDFSGSTILVP